MGFSNKSLEKIRYYGRKVVLPTTEIKKIVYDKIFSGNTINSAIDFGGGTLFWSKWLHNYVKHVASVDTFYKKNEFKDDIFLCNDLPNAYIYIYSLSQNEKSLIWISDVLHHLSQDTQDSLMKQIVKNHQWVVIKDIDCRYWFGNFMNKMHDRVINSEKIRDINPLLLEQQLKDNGFTVSCFSLHKLWYPHFLIIAEKE